MFLSCIAFWLDASVGVALLLFKYNAWNHIYSPPPILFLYPPTFFLSMAATSQYSHLRWNYSTTSLRVKTYIQPDCQYGGDNCCHNISDFKELA